MTSINLRPDDNGIQSLKKENATREPAREVSATAPAARTHTLTEKTPLPPQMELPITPYKGVERRKGERRKSEQSVILDTRIKRERRRQAQDAAPTEDGTPKIGIDVYS